MTRLPNTPYKPIPAIAHGTRKSTNGVVIHTVEGSAQGAINWFESADAKGVGAHVVIGQRSAVQLADLDALCWHAVGANRTHIGFEHEGFASYSRARWLSKSNRRLLRLSANRTAWVCWHYKLGAPKRGRNVFAHADFPEGRHTDPGKGWPWWFYIWLAGRAYRNLGRTGSWA